MNITILTNRDLASNISLNYLVSGLRQHKLSIFLSDQVGRSVSQQAAGNAMQPLIDLKFFEQQLFNQIVFPGVDSQPTSICDNQDKLRYLTFTGLAMQIGSPIETLNDINQPGGLNRLAQTKPDLVLSVRFGKILHQAAISIPKQGVLNLHSGLLPEYQGVMATFWAMLNQEKEYGSTLHFIDSSAIDSGPVICRIPQPLDVNRSYLENLLDLYQSGCEQMINAVNAITDGVPLKSTQQSSKGRYYSFPDEKSLASFVHQKMRLFDSQHVLKLVETYQMQFLG